MFAISSLELIIICGFTASSWPLGLLNPSASTRKWVLASRSSICRCFSDDDTGCLCGPGDLPSISKSNCQNKPKFTGVMRGSQLRGRGFIHITGWYSSIFYSPSLLSPEVPKVLQVLWTNRLTWPQLKSAIWIKTTFFFMKVLTEHYSLPYNCTETTIL